MKRGLVASLFFAVGLLVLLPNVVYAAGPGEICGGIFPMTCEKGLFCSYPAGQCGKFDMTGTCEKRPHICSFIYRPVCGCNGKTYSNDCVRQSAGVSLDHPGRCTRGGA